MESLRPLVGKHVELDISGKVLPVKGNLIDLGSDILVLYNGMQFLYVPTIHLQNVKPALKAEFETDVLPAAPFENQTESISYRKMLTNAKGMFVELYIFGNQPIHGFLTEIMDDYFVLYSPVYHDVLISAKHLKYLIPYNSNATPYSLPHEHFLENPFGMTFSTSFDQQLKQLQGEFVVLDLGEHPNRIGLLKKADDQSLELVTANGGTVYMHKDHVKTVHLP